MIEFKRFKCILLSRSKVSSSSHSMPMQNFRTLVGQLVQSNCGFLTKLSKKTSQRSCFAYPYGYNMAACLVHPGLAPGNLILIFGQEKHSRAGYR